jgi:hypothetical protein
MQNWEADVARHAVPDIKKWFRTPEPYKAFWPTWWADIQRSKDNLFLGGGGTLLTVVMALACYAANSKQKRMDTVNGCLRSVVEYMDEFEAKTKADAA